MDRSRGTFITPPPEGGFWFPGRWIGGISLILGPLLLLTAALLRVPFHYFFDAQLTAYAEHPARVTAAYSCFTLGCLFTWPAVITVSRLIGMRFPALAIIGGITVVLGLMGRVFHAGIDHLAFQLVNVQGLDTAIDAVDQSYLAFHVVRYFNGMMMVGWLLLAIGAYRAGVMGWFRSIALASLFFLPFGTLKGTRGETVFLLLGLCIAFIPLGIRVLREGPRPSRKAVFWSVAFVVGEAVFIWLSIIFPEIMQH
jgi:hypothetical protein